MAEQLGYLTVIQVSDDGGSNYTSIGGVKDSSLEGSQDNQECTDNDDGLWKAELAGHKQMVLNFTTNYDESDAGQEILRDAYFAGTTLMFKFRPRGSTSGYKEALFSANCTSFPINAPTQGVEESSYSYTSTGTVTFSNQT